MILIGLKPVIVVLKTSIGILTTLLLMLPLVMVMYPYHPWHHFHHCNQFSWLLALLDGPSWTLSPIAATSPALVLSCENQTINVWMRACLDGVIARG